MCTLVAAGTREKPRQQNRSDKPREYRDLKRSRCAAHRQIDRECREGAEASEQPRRDEGAMTCARQRIVARRGMQQCVEAFVDDIQNCHGSRAFGLSSRDAPEGPLIIATVSERN